MDDPRRDEPEHLPVPEQGTRRLTRILDELIRIPGTDFTFGLDAIASFVPGYGDAAGVVMGAIILLDAVRCRVPLPTLMRMIGNVGIDAALGAIPVAGPFADMVYRSNRRNLKLLDAAVIVGKTSRKRGVGYVLSALGIVVGTVAAMVLALVLGAIWLLAAVRIG